MKAKRIALVTEGGNGLGFQFATILNSSGFEVIIMAKGASYTHLKQENLKGITILEADINQTSEAVKVYAFIKTHYGKLDLLVNNAEIANGFGQKLTELDMKEVRHLFDENVFSVMELTKRLVPLLEKGQSSRILNITSALGNVNQMGEEDFHYSSYKMTAYSMAKAALDMFSVLLSNELKANQIQVERFDPIRMKNCTHNSVNICHKVEEEFLQLLQDK